MPQHDDLELFELLRARSQKRELEQAAQSQLPERPEQRAKLLGIGGDGRSTLRALYQRTDSEVGANARLHACGATGTA